MCGGGGGGGNNSCHLKELISPTVDEAMRGALSCRRRTFFWASPRHNSLSFSFEFFSKLLLNSI